VVEATRRSFLASLGGGLLVLLATHEDVEAQESGGARRTGGGHELPSSVAAWLQIAPDGKITAFTGKVEVGQNARTSLTQAVADELRCAPEMVQMVMGDTDRTPWDMGTFGSRTTPTMVPELRKMAATAREALVDAAAKQWSVGREQIRLESGALACGERRMKFGDAAKSIQWVTVVGNADLVTEPKHWTVAGTSLTKVNAAELVTGKHKYVSDHRLPEMLFGRVLRPPSFGAKLVSVDTAAAERMAGVKVIRDGDFVGVAAKNEALAQSALANIEAKWNEQPNAPQQSDIKAAESQQRYSVAYIAHAPLEPRAAMAQWSGEKLTVWAGTQRPFGVRSELASAFKMDEKTVRVLMPDTGSGYGGKHTGECAIEAAQLAKHAGAPVKLIWTREEEFTWAYFRPAGIITVGATLDQGSKLTSWTFANHGSGPSGLGTPYDVPQDAKHEQYVEWTAALREGSYRGLAATANHFARESYMDELATQAGMDPLAFRMKNLTNERLRAVLQAAADRFEWSKQRASPNRGFGLACGVEKGGHIATCVEVTVGASRQLKVERIVAAWDCGAIINPLHLRNQVEGAIVMGLGGALFEEIEYGGGRISNPRFSQYRVPRFSDVPAIDVILIDRKDIPSAGAGETPIVAIAPAIANAVYSATGQRVRSMPILRELRA
jgi:isoquinoline 1-oxidoreductase